MTTEDFLDASLGVHGAILVAALAACYKYCDRSETFAKSLSGTDAVLVRLRRLITSELVNCLGPLLGNADRAPSLILDGSGATYFERPVDPTHSERFTEVLARFLETNVKAIVAYRSFLDYRDRWCFWSRFLSWSILLLVFWQVLVSVLLFSLGKVVLVRFPFWFLSGCFLPTILCMFGCLAALALILHAHDKLLDLRREHDAP